MRESFSLFHTLGTVAKDRPESNDAAALAEEIAAHLWRSLYMRADEHLESIAREAEVCVYTLRGTERSESEARTWYAGQMQALGTIARLALEASLPSEVKTALQEHNNLTPVLQALGSTERSIAALAQHLGIDSSQLEKELEILVGLKLVQRAKDTPEDLARLTGFGHEALRTVEISRPLSHGVSGNSVTSENLVTFSELSTLQVPLENYDDPLWRFAWTDGRLGVEPSFELIEAQAELKRYERLNETRMAAETASATERVAEQMLATVHDDWRSVRSELDALKQERRQHPEAFSLLLGRIYGLFALLIFIADLPVALLVSEALLFRGQAAAFAVALGLAGLTIGFKLVIDSFWYPSLSRDRIAIWARTILLAFVASGLVAVLILLGFIRAMGPLSSPALTATTFAVMAILFPIVAAFCLSKFHVTHQNAARVRTIVAIHDQMETKWVAALRAHEQARAVGEQARAKYAEVLEDRKYAEFSKALYRHGYERGYALRRAQPITGAPSSDAALFRS